MDLKKLDYITAPEEWIFSVLLHFSNSCSNEIYSFSDMA